MLGRSLIGLMVSVEVIASYRATHVDKWVLVPVALMPIPTDL
jgi:hypothetical protein